MVEDGKCKNFTPKPNNWVELIASCKINSKLYTIFILKKKTCESRMCVESKVPRHTFATFTHIIRV
jgi:hypothetical protein